jgi:hypothetical protein
VKKLAALILFGSALSLWAQDKPHGFVEAASFADSYLQASDVLAEKIVLDISKPADDLDSGLEVFFDVHEETFINFNLGALWGFGFFARVNGLGQFKIPQSMGELPAEDNQTYYLPLAYEGDSRVDNTLALKDNESVTVAGNYKVAMHTPFPHRFVEAGFDVSASFANSYLRASDVFAEKIVLDISKLADDLDSGLGVFFDVHGETFINFNLGALWGFGFFAGVDGLGQFNIPQSMVELLSEGNQKDKTYSDSLDLGGAAFFETGFWASAKIRRIKFTIRPAYYLPLAYVDDSRVDYTFELKDDGTVKVAGNYKVAMYTPFPLYGLESLDDIDILLDRIDIADMLGKGGVDLVLRAEYPVRNNFIIGGSLGHIPLVPARLTDKYTLSGGFEISKSIEDVLDGNFDTPDLEPVRTYETDHKAVFRPFKIGFDAVYRPFNIRLLTLKPELALVFNSIYSTPFYLDFGITGELNLLNIFTIDVGTHLEDLVWKERIGLALNFRIIEFIVGLTTQSQEFLRSFQGAGFGVDFGLRIGF